LLWCCSFPFSWRGCCSSADHFGGRAALRHALPLLLCFILCYYLVLLCWFVRVESLSMFSYFCSLFYLCLLGRVIFLRDGWCGVFYSLRSKKLVSNIVVSRTKMCQATSILATSFMEQRE
jgi:cytosine/uracil/thiamine/allantoin permease